MTQNQRIMPEHRRHIRPVAVCAGDRLVLRVVDVDGGGGLTAAEMVKDMAKG